MRGQAKRIAAQLVLYSAYRIRNELCHHVHKRWRVCVRTTMATTVTTTVIATAITTAAATLAPNRTYLPGVCTMPP